MESVTSWLERKMCLKVNAAKTRVVRPGKSAFLGSGFWKSPAGWKPKPHDDRRRRLYDNIRQALCRRKAAARPLAETFRLVNA